MNNIIENIMQRIDKESKSLKVLAISLENTNVQGNNMVYNGIQQSNEVICPMCQESCKLEIKNYRIKLYDCKNKHVNDNIALNEFKNLQNINENEITCKKCNKTKFKAYNQQFYKCADCQINLCPLCKSTHNKNHKYNKKEYIYLLHYQDQLFLYIPILHFLYLLVLFEYL